MKTLKKDIIKHNHEYNKIDQNDLIKFYYSIAILGINVPSSHLI